MASQLPTNAYDTFTAGQLGSAQNVYDFWSNQFQKFNPTPAQVQPVNTMPAYQQAGQTTMSEMNGLTNGGQNNSGFDINRAQRELGNAETSTGLKQNLNNNLNAGMQNYSLNLQGGLGNLGRMNQLAGTEKNVNELPVDQIGQTYANKDTINSMWNAYNNSKPDFWSSILNDVGSLAGTMAVTGV